MSLRPHLLILATFCFLFVTARADQTQRAIRIDCQAVNDVLVIEYFTFSPGNYAFSSADGTYDPWALVSVSSTSERTYITKTFHADHDCNLPSGAVRVRIEPHVFNANVLGRCGATMSAAVTVYRGKKVLMEKYAFETDCLSTEEPVSEVRIDGRTERISKLKDRMPELLNAE